MLNDKLETKIYYILTSCIAIIFALELFFIFSNKYVSSHLGIGEGLMFITSGYAFTQGLNNELFVSAFGGFFELVCGTAFNFLDFFNLGINKILFTVSLFFSAINLFLWGLIRIFTKYKIPFLCVLLLAMFSPWSMHLEMLMPTEIHNPLMWGVCLLQMVFSVIICKDGISQISNKEIIKIAIIQGLFLIVALNYKINFFMGMTLVCLSPIFYLNRSQALRYIVWICITIIASIIVISLISNYNYLAYFKYVILSGQDKGWGEHETTTIFRTFFIGFIFFIALWVMLALNKLLSL
ncbi:MAG: hypothetical protein LBC07_04340, partial [Elusimicrobiota bacterium]|nr:hypothetical protein [Elusimicrobiota bacterium]